LELQKLDNQCYHTFGFSGHLLNSGLVLLNGARSLSTKDPKPIFRSFVIFVMLPVICKVSLVMDFLQRLVKNNDESLKPAKI
jgi:hypothetical protein